MQHDSNFSQQLQAVSTNGLSAEDQLNRTLMLRLVETRLEGERLHDWEMPVDQMNGPHLEYAGMSEDMPFKTAHDYENYLSRLNGLPRVFEQITEDMHLGMRDHLMPPRYLLEKVAEEAQDVAQTPLSRSLFTVPLKHFPNGISAADRQRLTTAINQAVSETVLPVYAKFAHFVKTEYAPMGRTEYGVWSLPDGAARYRHAIHAMTTTDRDPAELHALGLKQVNDIEAQMLVIAKKEGYADLKSFNAHIFADRKLYGTSGPQILAPLPEIHRSDVREAAAILRPLAEKQAHRRAHGGLPGPA